MRVTTRLLVAAGAVLALVVPPAGAGQGLPDGEKLRLADAVAIALEKSPLLRVARHEVEAADAGIDRSRAAFLPRLDLSESFQRSDNPVFVFSSKLNEGRFTRDDFEVGRLNSPDPVNNFRTSVQLSQPLYTGGKAWHGLARARLGREAAERGLDRQRQEVMFETARAYYGLLLTVSDLEVVRAALAAGTAHRDLARSRFEAGLVVESDALQAEVRLASLREQEITASSRVTLARAALNDVMGVALDRPAEPADALGEPRATAQTMTELETVALDRRPDYRRLAVEEQSGERAVALARAEYLPTVSAAASYDVNRADVVANGQDSWFVGLMLQWNLFNGLGDRARVAETQAGVARVRALRDRMASGIRLEVRDAWLAATSARDRIVVARQAVAQAEESLRVVRDRYGAGLTTIVDLLTAEAALTQARGNLVHALYDANVARARLELAAGTIAKDVF